MERKNSMEISTTIFNMVIGLMNVKRNQNLKESVTNVRNKDTRHQNAKIRHSI